MRRLIIGAIILIAIIGIGLVLMQTIGPWRQKSVHDITDDDITSLIKTSIPKRHPGINVSHLSVKKKEIYLDTWLIAEVTLDDEPAESEARIMVYVFSIENNTLRLLAYSGDGFSTNSFPADTPDSLIQKANRP